MNEEIDAQIDDLQSKIDSGEYAEEATSVELWRGADVIITKDFNEEIRDWLGEQPLVISLQELPAMRRAVITEHAQELSWLFHELGRIFVDELDYVSKYDFFGGMAQSAINLMAQSSSEPVCEDVLASAMGWARAFNDGQDWPA